MRATSRFQTTHLVSMPLSPNISYSHSAGNNANFISVLTASPYTVFGVSYPLAGAASCPTLAISVTSTGALDSVFANVTYDTAGGIHGTDLSLNNDFLYSADDSGNSVYVHSYDSATGEIEEVQYLAAEEGSDPRHITVHPGGEWVYAVYEAANSVASYSRDQTTGELTYTNTSYSLLPTGYTNLTSYWADEVLFSVPSGNSTSPKYLLAATRSRTVGIPGYVSAFSLSAEGAILEQLFLLPTTESGGSANAVSPAEFSEQYFGITDSGSNFLEMWKITEEGNATTAAAVAHLALEQGPANIVWYS